MKKRTKHYVNLIFFFYIKAYGVVFLVRKRGGIDHDQLYAMKVLKKSSIVLKKKTAEHTRTERQVSFNLNFHVEFDY